VRILVALAKKEVKELLTIQLLIPMLAMMLIFTFIGHLMKSEVKKAGNPQSLIIADYDQTNTSRSLIKLISNSNFVVQELSGDAEFLVNQAKLKKINTVLVLPESLEARVISMQRAEIKVYSLINNFSAFSEIGGATLKAVFRIINDSLSTQMLRSINKDAPIATIKNPLKVTDFVRFREQIIQANPTEIKDYFRVQTIFVPVILLIVIIYLSQMIAAAMGQEKENKTLETLLTFPVSRMQILIGKMLGAGIVAIIISLLFLLGMKYYMGSFNQIGASEVSSIATQSFKLFPSQTVFYAMLTLTLFLAILCAASLATLLSIFASDAKQAQMLITPLMIFVLFPYFITMMIDINSLSPLLKIILYIIPFTYPFLVPQALFLNQITLLVGGMVYMFIFTAITMTLAAKIFSSDRVLTTKLRIRR
jgi:ABC-2 type transport system permease protein